LGESTLIFSRNCSVSIQLRAITNKAMALMIIPATDVSIAANINAQLLMTCG